MGDQHALLHHLHGRPPVAVAAPGGSSPARRRGAPLAAWRGLSPDPEMQIDPAALEFDVLQLDLAVLVAAASMASTSASCGSRCSAANMSRTE